MIILILQTLTFANNRMYARGEGRNIHEFDNILVS